MESARSINLILMDGTVSGRYEYRLDTWNIDTYKIPHEMLKEAGAIACLHTPGVYFLFGERKADSQKFIYVGEAEDVHKRLTQKHNFEKGKDAEYWDDAVIFVALSEGDLDKAKIKYLENRFYELAKDAGNYYVINGNVPKKSKLASLAETAMENLILNAELVMPSTGYDVFAAKKMTDDLESVKSKDGKTTKGKKTLPPLPSDELDVGVYVKTAFKNLFDSGFVFTDDEMSLYGSVEGSKKYTHRNLPFFWILKDSETRNDLKMAIQKRYWATEYKNGKYRFLIFSQWYKDKNGMATPEDFNEWYKELQVKHKL